MGDRNNPIKFGPEWLRNLGPERSIRSTGAQASNAGQRSPTTNSAKVTLARCRYGREEMLALYDRSIEAPALLKANDTLYVARGQPPYALSNTFDDDARESNSRALPAACLLTPIERYTGVGRGRGMPLLDPKSRGMIGDVRGKARGYSRPTSAGRGWHGNRFSGIPDDDQNQPLRPWNNSNHQTLPGLRPNNGESPDWQKTPQLYRMKRQTSTNWRQQQGRDEGEEWRSADGARRPQEKWAEWGWQQETGNRPNQEKQWHNNRRTWMGSEGSEEMPEWAVDSAEAVGGTFDATGAFHGYSSDDSNIPKTQETPYPLTKSHTHGSFVRNKIAEEGSEEWWASEKAKKLSPKRFDTNEIQFKKTLNKANVDEKSNSSSPTTKTLASNDRSTPNTGAIPKRIFQTSNTSSDKPVKDQPARSPASKKGDDDSPEIKTPPTTLTENKEYIQNKTEDVTKENVFDSRSNSEKQNEKGNFQSVILTSNNTLRQKHQKIVVTPTSVSTKNKQKVMKYVVEINNQPSKSDTGSDLKKAKETDSDKIVEDILKMSLDDGIPSATINQMLTSQSNSSMDSSAQVPYPSMQMRMASSTLQNLNTPQKQSAPLSSSMQTPEPYNGMMQQPIGMTNSMLNASLGLPLPNSNGGLPQAIPAPLSNTGMSNPNTLTSGLQAMTPGNLQQSNLQQGNMQNVGLQSGQVPGLQSLQMQGFGMQSGGILQGQLGSMPNTVLPSLGPAIQNATNPMVDMSLFDHMHPNDINYANSIDRVTALQRLQQIASQRMNNAMYSNMINQQPPINNMGIQLPLTDQWYYEDPNNTIQGPFSSQEMFYWYRAGFFNQTLMVRRGWETVMRPLGSYGPMPFGPMDLHAPFPMGGGYGPQQSHNMVNQQPGLGMDVQSLWGQPANNAGGSNHMWMQPVNNNSRNENPINNLPVCFWDNQPADMPAAPLLPETIKTEEEILAQMRAAQTQGPTSPLSFFADSPVAAPEADSSSANAANINQQQKHTQKDVCTPTVTENTETEQQVPEKNLKTEESSGDLSADKVNKVNDKTVDLKLTKEVAKVDNGKLKSKEPAKPKTKKAKEDKKEDLVEVKPKEEEVKVEKRSAEPSPSSNIKKEDKSSKKDLDKEKKEWIKEGFTIVKGADKSKDKDSKKKAEEAKAAEEAERKRKEEEKLAAEEKKRQLEATKKQEAASQQAAPTRQAMESVGKKAPWSASTQVLQSSSRDGPTLAEIQRLEREKKLEQMKEQQQMMQIIAQQQAAALAREQEMQTGLGWAKKPSTVTIHQTLAEIQAEARKQAAAVAAATTVSREEVPTPPPVNAVPWSNVHNGGAGFWDSPQPEPVKPVAKPAETKAESKNKKKVTVMQPPKRENTPSVEFDIWCTNMLVSWRDTGIDVPTFVSFLRDIESPYEVKDYVKCYLGDSREASDFARQFLEKRSRLLRVGMVTPSDDLCSPAVAVNPRAASGLDHADLKAKGKKTKKNRMLKVDARNILGFSVTASEDRINVGDIDTV